MNTTGISLNDKYLLLLLLLLQLMFKLPSISMHRARRLADEYATDSLLHRWCCDPSRTTPLSVAPSSGWRHELSGRHAPVAGPMS